MATMIFLCIFILNTPMFFVSAINVDERIRFVADFMETEGSSSIISFLPVHLKDGFTTTKTFAKSQKVLYSSSERLHRVRPRMLQNLQNTRVVFLADLRDKECLEVLKQAENLQLLKYPNKWILFYEIQLKDNSTIILNKNDFHHDEILTKLEDIYIAIDTEVYVAFEYTEEIRVELVYRRRPHLSLSRESYNTWHRLHGFLKPRNNKVIAMRRLDLQGLNVTAVTIATIKETVDHFKDYLYRHIDTPSKLSYYTALHLFEWLNATGFMNVSSSWGYQLPDGTFDGAIREMAEGRSDFGAAIFFMQKARLGPMVFVGSPSEARVLLLFKRPSLATVANIYMLPFSRRVWWSIVGLLLLSAVVFAIAMIWESRTTGGGDRRIPILQGIQDAFYYNLGLMCQQGNPLKVDAITSRQVLLLCLFAFMFLYTAFSANVVALLQSTTNDITSVGAILNSPLEYGATDIVYNHHIFKNENRPVHRALWLKKGLPQGDKFFLSVKDGIRRVREGMYAFHMEATAGFDEVSRTFLEHERCTLSTLKYISFPNPHFVVARQTTIMEQIRIGIYRIKESGVQRRTDVRMIARLSKCDSGAAVFTAVGLQDVAPAFKCLAILYAAAVIIFLSELLVHFFVKRNITQIKVEEEGEAATEVNN